ncbi:MAG: hypothetical protein QW290_02630 [Sulfolobales archaeon]
MNKNVVAVATFVVLLITLVSVVFVVTNPFKTFPTASVVSAKWELNKEGYVLRAVINSTAPMQLVGIEADTFQEYIYDINPPSTEIYVPVRVESPTPYVRLHFSYGSPVTVYVKEPSIHDSVVTIIPGEKKIFVLGTLDSRATAIITRVSKNVSVGFFAHPDETWMYENYVLLRAPEFQVSITPLKEEVVNSFSDYTTLVFLDVAPEPNLLTQLLKSGKAVVLFSSNRVVGERRFALVNGTFVFTSYSPEKADIDYFGMHATVQAPTEKLVFHLNLLTYVQEKVKNIYSYYGVITSPHMKLFTKVYGETDTGIVVLGKSERGFVFASIELKYVIMLALTGFFNSWEENTHIEEIPPFRGVYPLSINFDNSPYVVSIYARNKFVYTNVVRQPVLVDRRSERITLTIGVNNLGVAVWRGTGIVRIIESTYDGDPVSIEEKLVSFPCSVDLPKKAFRVFLVYVNDTLVHVIADEKSVAEKPQVVFEYSNVREFCYVNVKRLDDGEPLTLFVNGNPVAVLGPQATYSTSECRAGRYYFSVRDPYGREVGRISFFVTAFYEQPLFILLVLAVGSLAMGGFWATRRRTEKEVKGGLMVFYKSSERDESIIDHDVLEEIIYKLSVVKKSSPTIYDVVAYVHGKRSVMKVVGEVFEAFLKLLDRKKQYSVCSKYVPELDDTITLVGHKQKILWDLYSKIVTEMMIKFGGSVVPHEYVKDIINVDLTVILGNKLLLVTYAPTVKDVKQAIDKAITSFLSIRRMILPYELAGFAVVTEPEHVRVINSYIDDLLSGNENVAAELLRDTTIYTRLMEAPMDSWLKHYVMTAVPVTRLSPLMAFVKAGAVRICNKYYRFAQFRSSLGEETVELVI